MKLYDKIQVINNVAIAVYVLHMMTRIYIRFLVLIIYASLGPAATAVAHLHLEADSNLEEATDRFPRAEGSCD